jgi:hypothetical protein
MRHRKILKRSGKFKLSNGLPKSNTLGLRSPKSQMMHRIVMDVLLVPIAWMLGDDLILHQKTHLLDAADGQRAAILLR